MTPRAERVVVVGAGITGLLSALRLADAGVAVTVLEASEAVGGQVHTGEIVGVPVDLGAEAVPAATPGLADLLRRLGLEDEVVAARPGHTWLAGRSGLRALPEGVGPAGPSRMWPVIRSGILSPTGLARAACEPFVPRAHHGRDLAVGTFLARRFGRQLTERLVDPLLGNLHAGDIHRLSLAAAAPSLDQIARRHRSLVLSRRGTPPGPPPRFVTLPGGLSRIVRAVAADRRITVRCATPVGALEPGGGGYRLVCRGEVAAEADGVVLATPASVAAELVMSLDTVAGQRLRTLEAATVGTVMAAYPSTTVAANEAFAANGLLVPASAGHLLKAATFLGRKWSHLGSAEAPTDGLFLIRMSAGRARDDRVEGLTDGQLVDHLHRDLAALTGLEARPVAAVVRRWPATMPQLEVGHRDLIADVRTRLRAGHRIEIAGAAFDGVGIGACMRAAAMAADRMLADHVSEVSAA